MFLLGISKIYTDRIPTPMPEEPFKVVFYFGTVPKLELYRNFT